MYYAPGNNRAKTVTRRGNGIAHRFVKGQLLSNDKKGKFKIAFCMTKRDCFSVEPVNEKNFNRIQKIFIKMKYQVINYSSSRSAPYNDSSLQEKFAFLLLHDQSLPGRNNGS